MFSCFPILPARPKQPYPENWRKVRVPGEYGNLPGYLSILTIKNNGHYAREIRTNGIRKTAGTWEIKGETLWLTPDKKYKLEPYALYIGNGYLKIGEVGVHEKVK